MARSESSRTRLFRARDADPRLKVNAVKRQLRNENRNDNDNVSERDRSWWTDAKARFMLSMRGIRCQVPDVCGRRAKGRVIRHKFYQ